MKTFFVLCACLALGVCTQSCASYFSVTEIQPNKTFLLGEGDHPAYSVTARNVGLVDVEVSSKERVNASVPLGVLKPGQELQYSINPHTLMAFSNPNILGAAVKLTVYSTFFPSMGYKENSQQNTRETK